MEVEIYGKELCSHCENAKMLCTMKKVPFKYFKVEEDYKVDYLRERVGKEPDDRITFPQCFVDGELVGGAEDLFAFFAKQQS